jgi:hypothetical protein
LSEKQACYARRVEDAPNEADDTTVVQLPGYGVEYAPAVVITMVVPPTATALAAVLTRSTGVGTAAEHALQFVSGEPARPWLQRMGN